MSGLNPSRVGRPSVKDLLKREQEDAVKNKRPKIDNYFSRTTKTTSKSYVATTSYDSISLLEDMPLCSGELTVGNDTEVMDVRLTKRISELETSNNILLKRMENYKLEITELKHKIMLKEKEISEISNHLLEIKEKISAFQEKEVVQHMSPVSSIITSLLDNADNISPLHMGFISSFVKNMDQKKKRYSKAEHDFWIDCYNNLSHSQFNHLSENLNGPWRSTVQNWQGKSTDPVYELSWESIAAAVTFLNPTTPLSVEGNPMDTSTLVWRNRDLVDVGSTNPVNCMIDETATKIVVEFNPYDMQLYGMTAMPRWVLVRNISEEFDINEFFGDMSVQFDRKSRKRLIGVTHIDVNDDHYFLGYAQFETYEDWKRAIDKNGSDGVIVESIPTFPSISLNNSKHDIDRVFAEAEALSRPRSTYVYSLAVGQTTLDAPLYEVSAISTNNRYLQNQDHKLLTYNLMKMFNRNHVPVLQFVADGDSRFRNQMLQMSAYAYDDNAIYNYQKLIDMFAKLTEVTNNGGWDMPGINFDDLFHFIIPTEELQRASYAKHLLSRPQEPFSPDNGVSIEFYLGIRCLTDVFSSYAPIIGGLPRTCTQDQCHWLRKLVKSSTLSTKPLRLGNFVVAFSHLCRVYEMGPDFGLIRRDVDINNKTDQKSAERLIHDTCQSGLRCIDWAEGTAYLIMLGKTSFESWWKPDLSVIDRMVKSYFVLKVFHLWKLWVEKSKLNVEQHFITLELYRDTIIMCSSLIHLGIIFKLYLPDKPFLPWKWSEYPLESYYSSIRYLFGNDDEFSTLEYKHRAAKNVTQQKLLGKHTLLNTRQRISARDWAHPTNPNQNDNPELYSHNWTLLEFLQRTEAVDKEIQCDFEKLGMSNQLENEELFQVMSPTMRMERLKRQFSEEGDFPDIMDDNAVDLEMETPEIAANIERQRMVRPIRPPTVPLINIGGKRTTLSKYVTVYKQRGDKKLSGQRNIMRFRLADNDVRVVPQDKVMLHQGDYFLSKKRCVLEIIQLRRKKSFVFEAEATENIEVIGVVYRKVSADTFYAEPKFTKKNYVSLRCTYGKKLDVLETWYVGINKFIKIRRDNDMGNIDGEDDEDNDNGGDVYCYCQSEIDEDFVLCGNNSCRVRWYHFSCVGLNSNTVPEGVWKCPRCRKQDHWCTCGKKENYGEMIGCSSNETCKIEWFHLRCVNLRCLPYGDWYCDDCVRNGNFEEDNGPQYCVCYRSGNFHELVMCSDRSCETVHFHKCCVTNSTGNWDDWLCENCS